MKTVGDWKPRFSLIRLPPGKGWAHHPHSHTGREALAGVKIPEEQVRGIEDL